MNKKLISIAIAAAVAAPMAASAETTLYGRINNAAVNTDADVTVSGEYCTPEGCTSGSASASMDTGWDVEDYASRLGVKGSEDLGNGLKAIYQLEWHVETSDGGSVGPASMPNNRLGYVGLAGGFGTVAVGRQWTPYYGSVDKTDVFQIGGTNDAYMGLTRTGDAIAYVSPNMSGVTVKGAAIMTGEDLETGANDDTVDVYNLSLDYNNGPFSVGASYLSFENSDSDQWGIGAKYKAGMFAVIGQYEDGDVSSSFFDDEEGFEDFADSWMLDEIGSNADGSSWAIAGQAFFGNNTLTIKYGEKDADVSGSFVDYWGGSASASADLDMEEWVIQLEHHFSKRTRVFVIYDATETTAKANITSDYGDGWVETGSAKVSYDSDRFGIGIRHDF